jgi:hypothetical protein
MWRHLSHIYKIIFERYIFMNNELLKVLKNCAPKIDGIKRKFLSRVGPNWTFCSYFAVLAGPFST